MKIKNAVLVAALVALPALGLASPAVAHSGSHPFQNCSAAEAAGYSNIPQGDEHYAKKLDRDGDGYGCDKHGTLDNDGKAGTGHYAKTETEPTPETEDDESPAPSPSEKTADDKNLAETGGNSATPYVAGGGALLLGGGAFLALRRKRVN